jgi:lipoyl(octanoyl) transferase
VPCGIADREVTSLELQTPVAPPPSFEEVLNATARNFGRIFNRQIIRAESLEQILAPSAASVL